MKKKAIGEDKFDNEVDQQEIEEEKGGNYCLNRFRQWVKEDTDGSDDDGKRKQGPRLSKALMTGEKRPR